MFTTTWDKHGQILYIATRLTHFQYFVVPCLLHFSPACLITDVVLSQIYPYVTLATPENYLKTDPALWSVAPACLIFGVRSISQTNISGQQCLLIRWLDLPPYIFGNEATDGTYGSKYLFPGFGFDSGPKSTTLKMIWIFNTFVFLVHIKIKFRHLLIDHFCSWNLEKTFPFNRVSSWKNDAKQGSAKRGPRKTGYLMKLWGPCKYRSLFLVPLMVGIGDIQSPNWQEMCHLYTTYSPCQLGYNMLPTTY